MIADMDAGESGVTEEELDASLTEIDRVLRQQNAIIRGRDFRGWIEFCRQTNLSANTDHPLATRTFAWFRNRYGVRLDDDMVMGTTVVDILGDVYRLRCVRFYGTFRVVCSPALSSKLLGTRNESVPAAGFDNLLDYVESLTPELAGRLPSAECNKILSIYGVTFDALSATLAAGGAPHLNIGAPYIQEALDDLAVAVESFFLRQPNYGNSNYASLQASEKVIKSFILEKGGSHESSHKLAKDLLPVAYSLGLPLLDPQLIADIQCDQQVRYNATLGTKEKALKAHYGCLHIWAKVAPYLRRTTAQWAVRKLSLAFAGLGSVPALEMAYAPPTPPFIVPRP